MALSVYEYLSAAIILQASIKVPLLAYTSFVCP